MCEQLDNVVIWSDVILLLYSVTDRWQSTFEMHKYFQNYFSEQVTTQPTSLTSTSTTDFNTERLERRFQQKNPLTKHFKNLGKLWCDSVCYSGWEQEWSVAGQTGGHGLSLSRSQVWRIHKLSRDHHQGESGPGKDHIYRMVIVEGHCTMARSSSLGANCSLVDTKV